MTRFRTAYFCAACWKELARLPLHGCECGCGEMFKRRVPAPRRLPFRTGLEPIFALWREAARRTRRWWLVGRLNELSPADPRVPRLRIKLLELDDALASEL